VENDALFYTATNIPEGAVFDQSTNTLHWTPTLDESGIYEHIRFEASDGMNQTSKEISIAVLNAYGDIDSSGSIDLKDAVTILKLMAGLDVDETIRSDFAGSDADVLEDGKIGMEEVLFVLQYLAL